MWLKFKKMMLYLTLLLVLSSTANAQATFLVCDSVGVNGQIGEWTMHMSINTQMRTVTLHYGTTPEVFTNARVDDNLVIATGSAYRMGFSLISQPDDTAEIKISRFHGGADVLIWGRRVEQEQACNRRYGTNNPSQCSQPQLQRTVPFVCDRARRLF